MDASARRWCEAEWAFNGGACGGCATPCNPQPDKEDHQIDEAVNRTTHGANGRWDADGGEPYREREHAPGGNARTELPEDDGDLRERDGEIGEDDGGDLVGAAAETAGAGLHGFRNDVADAKRDVADVEAGGDGKGGVASEADHGGA